MTLGQLQTLFQARLLSADGGLLSHLGNGGRFVGVYDHAYMARLNEVMAEDYPVTRTVMGEDSFALAATAYLVANPSTRPSIRWIGQGFAGWLDDPALADLARFEWALGLAFDAPDDTILSESELATVLPDLWPVLSFDLHPSLSLIALSWDVAPVWQGAADRPSLLETPMELAVWRDPTSLTVRYRAMDAAEAVLARLMRDGADFAALCETAAKFHDPQDAAWWVVGLIRTWLSAGWLSGVVVTGASVP